MTKLELAFAEIEKLPPTEQNEFAAGISSFYREPSSSKLRFKSIHSTRPIYSVRIGLDYRAVGIRRDADDIVWYWIGSHAEYDKLIRQFRK